MTANSCESNIDTLKLIHQGTSQDQRVSEQLKPAYVQVDERKIEHAVVFAKAYAQYLKFYDSNNKVTGDWQAFFSRDVSVQLATAAIQDVDYYKINIKESFDFLNNREHKDNEAELKNQLGYLFSSVATLAKQLDTLKESLPTEIPLKQTLQNLIQNHLASGFKQLILYYRDGLTPNPVPPPNTPYLHDVKPRFDIMGTKATFKQVRDAGLSNDWIVAELSQPVTNWTDYLQALEIVPKTQIYGSENTLFERLNHIATHNLFTAIFDQFLKVFARLVIEAKVELEKTFSDWDKHEPHYALFLSFLKLLDYARAETNTLTERHLDFYYRDILRLKEKPAQASHAHLLIELAKHVEAHEIKANELFSAGKDALGNEVFFANTQSFIANPTKVTALKTLYRHKNAKEVQDNRLFASPIANSADGLGGKLTTVDQSWHPFFNKIYQDGKSFDMNMPPAEIGFAIASHYLWLAEGDRTITVDFTINESTFDFSTVNTKRKQPITNHDISCFVTTKKDWFLVKVSSVTLAAGQLKLILELNGADPAITSYSAKTHGYTFTTDLPMLLVKLAHSDKTDFIYADLEAITVQQIDVTVDVKGLKTLAISNDFGAVDTAKPFQPFGASPVKNSSLIIGCKEAFQKQLSHCTVIAEWQNTPAPYPNTSVNIDVEHLQAGDWQSSKFSVPIGHTSTDNFEILKAVNARTSVIPSTNPSLESTFGPIDFTKITLKPFIDSPDLSAPELFNSSSRYGYLRLKLANNFGQDAYEQALIDYIKSVIDTDLGNDKPKPTPPSGPFIAQLTLGYLATQKLELDDANAQTGRFFHLTPFGHAEQKISSSKVYPNLLPQFKHRQANQAIAHEAEFYIGVTNLKPAQNLALLFQVADGSADPLVEKPKSHIHWSYLSNNEWYDFDKYDVQDDTDELINSGIITFAMPDKANSTNTLLPAGQHWLRAAVIEKSEAVCKLLAVSAQALKVTFQNQNNDAHFLENALPADSISKLKQPDAAVKKVNQPFASFDGRAAEQSSTFYTRVSERLRHKDRTITLWDYEHLILEAFPQIYRVKCLNHTQYEPNETGAGIYNELAAGHVTVVTIPNQQFHNLHDPLRPYTSLGLLKEIEDFLRKKLSCFVKLKLHVKNPLFEEVRVSFKVKFYAGFDDTFYKKTLDTAITRFLSPWAFASGSNPTFGGKVYLSTLINFVEEQPYVDYVTDFTFIQPEPDGRLLNVTEIAGSKAVSILVSATHHKIDDISPNYENTSGETCPCASL